MRAAERFVLDTNTIISGALFGGSVPDQAVRLALRLGMLLFSLSTLRELIDVLKREKFDRACKLRWNGNGCLLMKRRTATIIVCLVDTVIWAFVALATFMSGSDAATRGLDQAAGWVVTALFLVTGAPAIALTLLRRAPAAALTLALAFPAAFAIAFVAAVVAFA